MSDNEELRQLKKEMRQNMQVIRAQAAQSVPDAGERLCRSFFEILHPEAKTIVSFYYPTGPEINIWPLVEALGERGCVLALPVVEQKNAPLIFRPFSKGDSLRTGPMRIPEPLPSAGQVDPEILIVPLLAFDQRGYRLGYGGGYYDRTLHDLRQRKKIMAVGVGYDCQQVPLVPTGLYDERLDGLLTPGFSRVFE